jgi:hypothetical protein
MRLSPPLRYLSWVSLAGAALASFELDRLKDDLEKSRRHIISFIFILLMLGLAALAVFQFLAPFYRPVGDLEVHRQTALVTFAISVLVALIALATAAIWRGKLLGPLLIVISYLELAHLGRHLYQFGSPADLFPQTPLIKFLGRQPSPFRVLGEGPYLFPSTNVFAGVEDIRTHDAVERKDYVDYLNRTAGYEPNDYFKFIRDVNAAGLDRLNVKYLISGADRSLPSQKWRLVYSDIDGRVFENLSVWPRIYGIDPRTRGLDKTSLTVTGYHETTNSVTFTARVPGSTPIIAHTSIVSDGGWRARIQPGGSLPVGMVEGLFLSITIPPGVHRIALSYLPVGLIPGAITSILVVGAFAVAIYRRRQRAVQRPAAAPE